MQVLLALVAAAGLEPTAHSLGITRHPHLYSFTKQNKH